jgi:hypothetical protein
VREGRTNVMPRPRPLPIPGRIFSRPSRQARPTEGRDQRDRLFWYLQPGNGALSSEFATGPGTPRLSTLVRVILSTNCKLPARLRCAKSSYTCVGMHTGTSSLGCRVPGRARSVGSARSRARACKSPDRVVRPPGRTVPRPGPRLVPCVSEPVRREWPGAHALGQAASAGRSGAAGGGAQRRQIASRHACRTTHHPTSEDD